MKLIETYRHSAPGYDPTFISDGWQAAFLNYAPAEALESIVKLDIHHLTDEVFVLLKGEATLYIGLERTPVKMEPCKLYNCTVGTWHNIVVSPDASVLIAENSDTDKTNTEYHYL